MASASKGRTACLPVIYFLAVMPFSATTASSESSPAACFDYVRAGAPFKPYVRELCTPDGRIFLRDAPHDHLHHHALMFALGVNGVTFWEETDKSGRQESDPDSSSSTLYQDPVLHVNEGQTSHSLDWIAPNGETVLHEQRRLGIVESVAPSAASQKANVCTWTSILTPASDTQAITLTGSHYYGLGMRFQEEMDNGGTFINSHDVVGEIVRGDERNFVADWCAYQAQLEDKPITVAMFGHPDNPRPTT